MCSYHDNLYCMFMNDDIIICSYHSNHIPNTVYYLYLYINTMGGD